MIIMFEIFRFEWLKALSLCAFINFLTSVIRFVVFFRTKHPRKPHHTLIDYELVLLFLPLSLLGLLLGHVIYRLLPMFAIAVLTAIFWAVLAIEIAIKAYRETMKVKHVNVQLETKKLRQERYEVLAMDTDSRVIDDTRRPLLQTNLGEEKKRINLSNTARCDIKQTSLNSDNEEALKQAELMRRQSQVKTPNNLAVPLSYNVQVMNIINNL